MAYGLGIATLPTINIGIQTAAYLILVVGFLQARNKLFEKHRKIMIVAATLNIISLASVMLPSFISIFSHVSLPNIGITPTVVIIHNSFGVAALSMAITAILKSCGWVGERVTLRKYMITMFTLWTIAYLIGITVFLLFYASFLVTVI